MSVKSLLEDAFKNQASNSEQYRQMLAKSQYPTKIALEEEQYEYNGPLPEGIVFFGRSDSFSGVGYPFFIFADELDIESMGRDVSTVFGDDAEIVYDPKDSSFNVRERDPVSRSNSGKPVFCYGQCPYMRFHGRGMLEYYRNSIPGNGSEDADRIIRVMDLYLGQKIHSAEKVGQA